MQIVSDKGKTSVLFDEADERIVWQIVAARLKEGNATLRDEFIKTAEEMARLARTLRDEPVVRRRPTGDQWTFRVGEDGRLRVDITGEPQR